MKRFFPLLTVILLALAGCHERKAVKPGDSVAPVPLTQVDIVDRFWAPKQEINRTVSLPYCFTRSEEPGGWGASSQYYEAAGYMMAKKPGPEFEAYIKPKIDALVQRQREFESFSGPGADDALAWRAGGTAAEAAVSWFEATGDRRLLDSALKAADEFCAAYGPGKKGYISGHEGQKIGLIRLSRFTGDEKYWQTAKFLLDIRGSREFQGSSSDEYPGEKEYNQNHKPVLEQDEAVGHAVRAMYLYIPLTDIAALTGLPQYARAADRLWENVVTKKMYLTGGIGSIRQQEKFGANYELPNVSAWHETCASYGNVVWNHRLFLLHRDARYIDVMERILYNGFLAGVSQSGDRFFYQNVLTSYGDYERFEWINVPCCPPNVVRLIAQLGSYIYAQNDRELYVNLYVGSKAAVTLENTPVKIEQKTSYPWDGNVEISVDPERSRKFAVYVRIPGWVQNRPVPGDLYSYLGASGEKPVLTVNGAPVELRIEKGYVKIERKWKAGDSVKLTLPMPVRKVAAHALVRDDEGRVALERGPLVYCAEWPDNGGSALNLVVPDEAALTGEFRPDLLGGVGVVTGEIRAAVRGADGVSVESIPHALTAIPYYAWANRGKGEMTVWLARDAAAARLKPVLPEPVARVEAFGGIEKAVTGYGDQNDDLCAVYDGVEPMHSFDESHLYYRLRPPANRPAWIQYDFKSPVEISSSAAYFVDDQRFCRLPESWRILVRTGRAWKPVENDAPYGVEKDAFNRVTFKPVKTDAVRIEIEPRSVLYKKGAAGPPWAVTIDEDVHWREAGLIEWRVK